MVRYSFLVGSFIPYYTPVIPTIALAGARGSEILWLSSELPSRDGKEASRPDGFFHSPVSKGARLWLIDTLGSVVRLHIDAVCLPLRHEDARWDCRPKYNGRPV